MGPTVKTTFSFLTVFLAVWLVFRLFLPLLSPFLVGTALALTAEPMVRFLHKKLHLPRSLSAGIGVTMTFLLLALLLLILGAFLVRELRALTGVLPDLETAARSGISALESWLLALTDRTPKTVQPLLRENVSSFFSNGTALLNKVLGWLLSLTRNLLSHVPDSALGLGTAVISGYMISAKLPKIRQWIFRRFPREKIRPVLETAKRMKAALSGWLLAQCKLMGTTLILLILGFVLLRIPYAPLWALAVSLVDALPVLGTGTVLLPWSLVCFLQRDGGRAVGLLGIYVLITLTRSILEPKLLGRHLGLDPLATLIAMYAGFKLWGVGGMILAPMLAVTALQLTPSKQ